jgi:hypothetical protein
MSIVLMRINANAEKLFFFLNLFLTSMSHRVYKKYRDMTTLSYLRTLGDTLKFVRSFSELTKMIRPIGPLRTAWSQASSNNLPRSGPLPGALGPQLSALLRRRRLRIQQQDLEAGLADYLTSPPYPPRSRPPS